MTETNDVLRQRIALIEAITSLESRYPPSWTDLDELRERLDLLTSV
jgi:hypothetical protein